MCIEYGAAAYACDYHVVSQSGQIVISPNAIQIICGY